MIYARPIAPGRGLGAVGGALLGPAAASWAFLWFVATKTEDMSSVFAMPMTSVWSPPQITLMIAMWVVMMAAMMLPSARPMVLAYERMDRALREGPGGSTTLFVVGYAVVWATFALGATGLQWALHSMTLVDGMGQATQSWQAGLLLIGAGVFQFSPEKKRSLGACRTPLGFLTSSWRDGAAGALRMGLHHGTLCLRCCFATMLLLFVLGVMNLIWVALLAIFVLAEKASSRGETISAIGGIAMIVWGLGLLWG